MHEGTSLVLARFEEVHNILDLSLHGNKIRATKDEIQQDSKINKQKSYFHNSRSKSCSFMKLHATSEISLVHPSNPHKQVVTWDVRSQYTSNRRLSSMKVCTTILRMKSVRDPTLHTNEQHSVCDQSDIITSKAIPPITSLPTEAIEDVFIIPSKHTHDRIADVTISGDVPATKQVEMAIQIY